jgi:site-specific DNA recombinase
VRLCLSSTSIYASARKLHYYKLYGSDGWRKLGRPMCDNARFRRQDLVDQIVWAEVIRLLEDLERSFTANLEELLSFE